MSLIETETIFGRIVTGYDVEQAVLALLKKWSSTYISEVERQHGIEAGTLSRIRGWAYGPTFDLWPEDQLPGVLVICTGLLPPPQRDGNGTYRAIWNVQVGVCASARTQAESHAMAQLLLSAHKVAVMQHPSLEGFAESSQWVDENYDPLTYDDTRSLYAGYATFGIEVDDVATAWAGPATPDDPLVPPTDPWPLWTTVQTHDEQVVNVPVDQELPEEE